MGVWSEGSLGKVMGSLRGTDSVYAGGEVSSYIDWSGKGDLLSMMFGK